MATKDQVKELVSKWQHLMEGLIKASHKRFKFARIYEKIIQNNEQKNYKLLLAIAYRVFKELKDIKITKSTKNKEIVTEFYENDLYLQNSISLDAAIGFIKAVSTMILEKIQKHEKMSHIEIIKESDTNKILFVF